PAVTWPEFAGIVRHRYHRRVVGTGQGAAAAGELDRLAGQHPGALGEYQHPDAVAQALAADAAELLQGTAGLAAVDGDRFEQGESPTAERHIQQLFLDQLRLWAEYLLQEEGFPGALVVGEDHSRLVGNVFLPGDLVADTHHCLGQPDSKAAPAFQYQLEAQTVGHEGPDD